MPPQIRQGKTKGSPMIKKDQLQLLQPALKNWTRFSGKTADWQKQNDSLNIRLQETSAKNEKREAEKNKRSTLEKGGKSGFKPKETAIPVIEAEVYETTTVLTGNRVKLRLLEEAWLNGVKIPAQHFSVWDM